MSLSSVIFAGHFMIKIIELLVKIFSDSFLNLFNAYWTEDDISSYIGKHN